MKVQMAEEKQTTEYQTTESPTIIIKATEVVPPKSRSMKKIVLFVVGGIVLAALILIAILVGMYIFTKAQKEIIEYSMKLDDNSKQDVKSDPNTNVVQFHVTTQDYEIWTFNDFNRDIQVVKVQSRSQTVCYASPLNRTTAQDPSSITVPKDVNVGNHINKTLTYLTADTPIPDTSFFSKTVTDACKGISIYWNYPTCDEASPPKMKRGICFRWYRYLIGCDYYFCYWYYFIGYC